MQDLIVMFVATFLIWFLFVGLGVLWVIDGKIKKEQVIHAIFASLFAFLLAEIFKYVFQTQRPFMVNGGDIDVLFAPNNGAFPSSHAAGSFALAITVFLHDRKVGFWFVGASLLIGIARVIANVHYPVDILGGAFLGTLIAVFVEKIHLFKLLQRKRK
jgi:undecaprenyl-diphosphatase